MRRRSAALSGNCVADSDEVATGVLRRKILHSLDAPDACRVEKLLKCLVILAVENLYCTVFCAILYNLEINTLLIIKQIRSENDSLVLTR
jgi:hypothetical protein